MVHLGRIDALAQRRPGCMGQPLTDDPLRTDHRSTPARSAALGSAGVSRAGQDIAVLRVRIIAISRCVDRQYRLGAEGVAVDEVPEPPGTEVEDQVLLPVVDGIRQWREQQADLEGQSHHRSAVTEEVDQGWARLESNQGPRDHEKNGLSNHCLPSMTYTYH